MEHKTENRMVEWDPVSTLNGIERIDPGQDQLLIDNQQQALPDQTGEQVWMQDTATINSLWFYLANAFMYL